jgi:hypothetical protein
LALQYCIHHVLLAAAEVSVSPEAPQHVTRGGAGRSGGRARIDELAGVPLQHHVDGLDLLRCVAVCVVAATENALAFEQRTLILSFTISDATSVGGNYG